MRGRFAATPAVTRAAVEAAAKAAGATVVEVAPPDARVQVADDAGATRLIGALIAARLPVIEVVAEEGRLERLFTGPAGGAS